ncbi:MAG: restriction endonuclease subunit S [Verrucomicrobiales bacterium]|nr:restriction endonuclease subunit S [Verrucomicrobiales bacterium]
MNALPENWEHQVLSDLVDKERGICYGIVQPGSHAANGVPVIRVNNIKFGRIETGDALRVSSDIEAKYRRSRLRGGEVLLTLVGSLGESAVVPTELAGWNVARAVGVIPVRTEIGSRWVELCLRSSLSQNFIGTRATTTVQATFNLRDLANIPIPLPPKKERDAIASVLGALDDKIELNRRMNETMEALAQSLFKSWFVDATQSALPKGWREVPFTETVEIIGGGTPKTSVAEYWSGDIPWFSVVDAPQGSDLFVIDTEKKITQAGVDNSSTQVLPIGTTIISARGTVGKVALVGVPMAMNQSCYGLRGKAGTKGFHSYFVTRALVSQLQQHAHGSVFDTITRDTLAGVQVTLPLAAVVEQFEEKVSPLMERIRNNLLESRTLAALRDALLPKLLSGELRVPIQKGNT